MNLFKTRLRAAFAAMATAAAIAASTTFCVGVAAAQGTADAAKGAEMTAGEVRKIDKDNRKITLKHDDIKSLDMPGMTMVFQVKDAALLERLKPGDKIRFAVEKGATGLLITTIEPAK